MADYELDSDSAQKVDERYKLVMKSKKGMERNLIRVIYVQKCFLCDSVWRVGVLCDSFA